MFKEYIDSHENELINDLETMIRIPSKLEGYDNPEYPFGKNIDKNYKWAYLLYFSIRRKRE